MATPTADGSDCLQLVEAVLLWTGYGRDMMPRRDDSLLVCHFGAEVAARLLPVVRSLSNDFYSSDARFVAADLEEMGALSMVHFRKKHPDMPDEIVEAFAWCYTFDFK
jgi:hypothetical protein